jgi:hypothetical protein
MTPVTPEDCDRLFSRNLQVRDLDQLMAPYEPEAQYLRREGAVVVLTTGSQIDVFRIDTLRGVGVLRLARVPDGSARYGGSSVDHWSSAR